MGAGQRSGRGAASADHAQEALVPLFCLCSTNCYSIDAVAGMALHALTWCMRSRPLSQNRTAPCARTLSSAVAVGITACAALRQAPPAFPAGPAAAKAGSARHPAAAEQHDASSAPGLAMHLTGATCCAALQACSAVLEIAGRHHTAEPTRRTSCRCRHFTLQPFPQQTLSDFPV